MIIIDNTTYDVPIISLTETCNFLDKYAERTVDGVLHRELIGTFFQQQLVFGMPTTPSQRAAYTLLWEKLIEAVEFHTVTVPDSDGVNFTFSAYFSNVNRALRRLQNQDVYWKQMSVNFTAQGPRARP